MTDIESAEFYAARLVVRLYDIDGDAELESRIATELRERDAAVRRAALEEAAALFVWDADNAEANRLQALDVNDDAAARWADRRDTADMTVRRIRALADSDAEGKP